MKIQKKLFHHHPMPTELKIHKNPHKMIFWITLSGQFKKQGDTAVKKNQLFPFKHNKLLKNKLKLKLKNILKFFAPL